MNNLSTESIQQVISEVVAQADAQLQTLNSEKEKFSEIENNYLKVRKQLTLNVNVELITQRKSLEEELAKQSEVVEFQQTTYDELCKAMDNQVLRNEIRQVAHNTIKYDSDLIAANDELKVALSSFLTRFNKFQELTDSKVKKNIADIQPIAKHVGGGYFGTSLYNDVANNLPLPKLGERLSQSQRYCYGALLSGVMPVLKKIQEDNMEEA